MKATSLPLIGVKSIRSDFVYLLIYVEELFSELVSFKNPLKTF